MALVGFPIQNFAANYLLSETGSSVKFSLSRRCRTLLALFGFGRIRM